MIDDRFTSLLLYFTVFLTGACVLIIEITATRILSPYFGNTIFTFSSVISVILGALSLGYYLGGKLADWHPKFSWFYNLIILSGLLVILLQYLVKSLLPTLSQQFSIITGPIYLSLILFFLPAFILAFVSPYAVKLLYQVKNKSGVGSISGLIFFWSTLGSIGGSLLTGFFLIPKFGIDQIMIGVSILLTILGILGLILTNKISKLWLMFPIILLMLGTNLYTTPQIEKLIHYEDGTYESIAVVEREYSSQPAIVLLQDQNISSAVFKNFDSHVFEYTKFVELYKLLEHKPEKVLFLGGGTFTTPRILQQQLPNTRIDVVEIEPKLYQLAQKYFKLNPSSNLFSHVQDGRAFLRSTQHDYDFIFSDVYHNLKSVPTHFTTVEFFQLSKSKLKSEGIIVVNLIGTLGTESEFIWSEVKTFQTVFPNSYLIASLSPTLEHPQNLMLVGFKGGNYSMSDFANHQSSFLSRLPDQMVDIDAQDLSTYPLLSDNYAPVDYLMAKYLMNGNGKI